VGEQAHEFQSLFKDYNLSDQPLPRSVLQRR